MNNAPVICIHGPNVREYPWNSQTNMQGNYFLIVPAVAGKCWGYNIETVVLVRFSVVYGGAKGRVVTICLSPQGGVYTRALKSESYYPRPSP